MHWFGKRFDGWPMDCALPARFARMSLVVNSSASGGVAADGATLEEGLRMAEHFADRLIEAVRDKGTPAMVGIDPQWELLPPELRPRADEGLAQRAAAYAEFGSGIVDAVADLVGVVKFQMAFFEALGPRGLDVLDQLSRRAHAAGLLVVFDGKRNDIGSSAAGYAEAYLGGVADSRPWQADGLTVNPYLGLEGLMPFVDVARRCRRGIFVLVRTSNPGAGVLQDLSSEGVSVHRRVAAWVEEWSSKDKGASGYGPVGAVVGATVPAQLLELRQQMPSAILLVPGFGAQGGSAADVAGAFDSHGLGAVVNNSRGILYAHQNQRFAGLDWRSAARAATVQMIEELADKTPASKVRRIRR